MTNLQKDMPRSLELRFAALIFLLATVLLWLVEGNRLTIDLDQGIYLEGAVRILNGQVPYRDFFSLTGPGSFWLLAGIFHLLGITLSHAQLIPILDLAFLTAAVYWLTAHLTRRGFAFALACIFFCLLFSDRGVLKLSHRLDSSALAMAALVCIFSAMIKSPHWSLFFAAGLFAALGAWITPPMLILGICLMVWILWDNNLRKYLPAYLGGIAFCSVVAAGTLLLQNGLWAMLQHMLWSVTNYPPAHGFAYGDIVGGHAALFSGAKGADVFLRAAAVFCIVLPAILPVAVYLGWLFWFRRSREEIFLLISSAALLISIYPRMDIGHLRYVAPTFYVLAGCLYDRTLGRFLRSTVSLGFGLLPATLFLGLAIARIPEDHVVETHVGQVRAQPDEFLLVTRLSQHIRPGESLFVFPYFPLAYFLTGGKNPTRYSFLQPGMMTLRDEEIALAELRANPPRWLIYSDFPAKAYLRIWPSSDPTRLRMYSIEEFIHSRYRLVEKIKLSDHLEFQILRLAL